MFEMINYVATGIIFVLTWFVLAPASVLLLIAAPLYYGIPGVREAWKAAETEYHTGIKTSTR